MALLDAAGVGYRNDSEYTLDPAKILLRPPGIQETDGYREHYSDQDHHTQHTYLIPWSIYRLAREWFLGYSYTEEILSEIDDPLADQKVAVQEFFRELPGKGVLAALASGAFQLRRVIPAQDPYHPHLFAKDWELLRGEGAWVSDPDLFAYEEDGEIALDAEGNPLDPGGMAYAENDQGGTVAPGRDAIAIPQPPTFTFGDGLARVRVTYRPRTYSILNDAQTALRRKGELVRWVVREEKYNIEAIPLARLAATSAAPLKYSEGPAGVIGVFVPEAGIQLLPTALLSYTWCDVPDRPLSAYAACVGKYNAQPFDGVGGAPTYAAETLVCMPWDTKRTVGPTGRVTWQIKYNFMLRPQKWNRFATALGGFYKATFGGGENDPTVYQGADFDKLFFVPPPVRYR